jgi:hypothetical protein
MARLTMQFIYGWRVVLIDEIAKTETPMSEIFVGPDAEKRATAKKYSILRKCVASSATFGLSAKRYIHAKQITQAMLA